MSNRYALAALIFILMNSSFAFARFELGLGSTLTYFSYKEALTPPLKSTETAVFPTVLLQGRQFMWGESYLQLRGEYTTNVASQYDGSDLNTQAPVRATNVLGFTTYEAALYVAVNDRFFIYTGYGYRAWNRILAGNPGYRELYTWNYLPIGFQFWFPKGERSTFGLDVSARVVKNARIRVITSETYSGGQDSEMDLGSITGYRVAVPIKLSIFTEPFSIEATPWFEHSELGESRVVPNATLAPTPGTGIQEPASKTDQVGVEVLGKYTF